MLLILLEQISCLIFLAAALPKLMDRESSIKAISAYELLPGRLSRPFGTLLPLIEITIALALLAGIHVALVAGSGCVLLAIFLTAQLLVMARGLEISCGCFSGEGDSKVGWKTVARTGSFLAIFATTALVAAMSPPRAHAGASLARLVAHALGASMITVAFCFYYAFKNQRIVDTGLGAHK